MSFGLRQKQSRLTHEIISGDMEEEEIDYMILANDLGRTFLLHQKEYEEKALEVLRSGWYVLGKEVQEFEKEWADYCGSKYCVGLASGLDALILAVRALGIGKDDEVIVQANTYIASVMGISINGATPVFVEPDDCFGIDAKKIEEKITPRTKAVMVVHLYGIPSEMDKVTALCEKHHLKLIEDCAQSHGAIFHGKMTGTFGDVGCFSFYPSKNLGAFGDAGCIVTDDEAIAKQIRILRNYGSEKRYYNQVVGVNSRLDEMQAGLLRVKLWHLEELTEERQRLAGRYLEEIKNPAIIMPTERNDNGDRTVWHQFVVRLQSKHNRDYFMEYLRTNDIGSIIHYPIPPHLSEAYARLGYCKGDFPITEKYADTVCSIPMFNGMTEEEQTKVINVINSFGV